MLERRCCRCTMKRTTLCGAQRQPRQTDDLTLDRRCPKGSTESFVRTLYLKADEPFNQHRVRQMAKTKLEI